MFTAATIAWLARLEATSFTTENIILGSIIIIIKLSQCKFPLSKFAIENSQYYKIYSNHALYFVANKHYNLLAVCECDQQIDFALLNCLFCFRICIYLRFGYLDPVNHSLPLGQESNGRSSGILRNASCKLENNGLFTVARCFCDDRFITLGLNSHRLTQQ